MCSLKTFRGELLQRCAGTFRHYDYHGTTMGMLSSACGLAKASFYHYYPNREALFRSVLEWAHQRLAEALFDIVYDPLLTPRERLEKLGHKTVRLFQDGGISCLMGAVAVGASYGHSELIALIRNFLDDWAQAFAQFYRPALDGAQVLEYSQQLVADFGGAILLAHIYDEPGYIDSVTRRALEQLAGQSVPTFSPNEAFRQTVETTGPHSGS